MISECQNEVGCAFQLWIPVYNIANTKSFLYPKWYMTRDKKRPVYSQTYFIYDSQQFKMVTVNSHYNTVKYDTVIAQIWPVKVQ